MLETLWTGRSRQPAPPRPPHSTSLQRFSDKRRSHEAPTSFEGHENQMWMFSKSKRFRLTGGFLGQTIPPSLGSPIALLTPRLLTSFTGRVQKAPRCPVVGG